MQADLAYAAERITHDYPEPTAQKKGKISTVSDYFRNIRTHSVHPRVSVGYDFGGWRIAADYARYRKWNDSKYSVSIKNLQRRTSNGNRRDRKTENQENGTFHAVSSLGLSTIYDFDTGSRFKPYIGMRVAYGHVRHQVRSVQQETVAVTTYPKEQGVKPSVTTNAPIRKLPHHESRSISSLGFGAVAGVGIDITPKLTLDAGYRYHNWGRLENTRFKTHEASLGVRYRF
ncbi:outer membrane preprotein PIIc [Neisseria gonorrhoeae]|nr:outer membrane preprotein PIIc [Neisseria gonorrhoeae]SBO67775.1 outer membrane preprotein PIIc [Neisseria gonorrhoeae]